MDRIGGWPDLQQHEDLYVYKKLARICRFEWNLSLRHVAVKEHVKVRSAIASETFEAYAVWRDWHRVLPFSHALEELSIGYLRTENQSLTRKLAHILVFIFGALAQFTKTRYKLDGDDLQYFTWEVQYFASSNATDPNNDLIFERAKPPRIVRQ